MSNNKNGNNSQDQNDKPKKKGSFVGKIIRAVIIGSIILGGDIFTDL